MLVLAMFLKVILVNFNEMISDYCDYNYDDDDVFLAGYKLSPAITCSNKGRKNNV